MPEIVRGFDPGSDRVLDVRDCFFRRSPVAHAAGQIGRRRQKASTFFHWKRLNHDWIFEPAHCCFLTASTNATSFENRKIRDPYQARKVIVADIGTNVLTVVAVLGTSSPESRSRKGRQPVTPAGGARAVPAGGGSSPQLPGGSGQTPGRHDDRSARSSLDWDRRGRVTPALWPSPRKRVLELSCGVRSLQQVPWWDADRRARRVWRATASVRCGR
jgi:hypothetical protein